MSDSRREFLKKSMLLSGAAGLSSVLPASIQRAFAIDPAPGSTFLDAEHVVILMQENRSFDHCFGTLQGVRGFNDPRAISLPDKKPVWLQTNEKGETYAPFRLDMMDTKITWMGSLPHSRASQVDAYNEGKYDNWLIAKRPGNKMYASMPLTLGYYTREDLPFNYAMADAFTVCDQNFCSAMTSTTPNRSFFWTGKITHQWDGIEKAHIRNDDFSYAKLDWGTFPEQLEKNGIDWKFYQNEISCGGGWKGEERAWLANFGCNLLEFFAPYHVKFSERYIASLQAQVDTLPDEINKLQEESPSSEDAAAKNKTAVAKKQAALDNARAELAKWNKDAYGKLTEAQKKLNERAFVVNSGDAGYRSVTTMKYKDGGKAREVTVPSGDILHQFRKDVNEGKLPTVSWLAGPQNFSDHPSAPWYGAYYVSEVLDILTKNPEVWKKTIFIVTYDENDGYYDHVPPFSIPDNNKPGTGKVSAGIDTEVEHVRLANELKQGVPEKQAREAPIGLGFRVPMLIASPWSRGGKVCSQVFEHTSTLQFLETFVNKKYDKNIHCDNISAWRRAISGDLTAAFSPFDGSSPKPLPFLDRDKFVQDIYNAKFKAEPAGFSALGDDEIQAAIKDPSAIKARQEKGTRPSAALPYELYANGQWNKEQQAFTINMAAGMQLFGEKAVGAPLTVYAPQSFTDEDGRTDVCRNWSFAVKKGDTLDYSWPVKGFEHGKYHLRLHGPNGFFREFKGTAKDPVLDLRCEYPPDVKRSQA
ncbi:phospholipase C, phosphocholine-specific [Chitinophaga sedimenti]|uniref:phosphocholine-specific phospholipase C n=1 Tax=Chitinophaga sedimenti TaxID=2033606 RepID=UPI002004BCC5|nr:phospholipase C, phosphocholine-specific [Chitinophaga sedimenti]MCK7556017.1 phospholipase C, phosphocholine-specific [Chitinophaga sedimenti]